MVLVLILNILHNQSYLSASTIVYGNWGF